MISLHSAQGITPDGGGIMKITCLGAAGCVTGSCFLLNNGKQYLVDCGLFQGGKQMEAMNRQEWGFKPEEISALFLTHAHIDHSGRIPKLVRDGFRGKIYTTLQSVELCKILLLDSAQIQEMEAEWRTRKNRRRGDPDVEPLYTVAEAEACFPLFQVIERDEMIHIDSRLSVRFRNAGHILGSSILEVWSGAPPNTHKVVFSGDLGRKDQLILKDPHIVFNADTLFVESTYGNRNHRSFEDSRQELRDAILYSYKNKEKVLIPSFAVERTQEILYVLGEFFRQELIPKMPVYLDSPLAIAATQIFQQMKDCYDEKTNAIVDQGYDPFDFPELILSRRTQDSIAINERSGPAIVIAGNGMCTAGRIKHHLKHNLWRQGSSLVIVGFQAQGSIGRKIIEGAETVKIFGEKLVVKAKVFTIGGFSAHADQSNLLEWIGHFENPRMRVYVVHGEQIVSQSFAEILHERFGLSASVPSLGEVLTITPEELEVAPVEEVEIPWQQSRMKIIRQLEKLYSLWRESPQALQPELLQDLAGQLSEMEGRLDGILQQAASNADKTR